MNFQHLKKVEPYMTYLDVAFSRAKKKADSKTQKNFNQRKNADLARLQAVEANLINPLDKILTSFPKLEDLPDFYYDLIKITIDFPRLKKSLGAMNWAIKKIRSFSSTYQRHIKRQKDPQALSKYRVEFYGRISSIMRQIKNELIFLEESRKTMKGYPAIKTGYQTIAIAGYPNVGKSSLLKALTTATPEVKNYPFTTKQINLGYIREQKIQLIDVPGQFDRKNPNPIEELSILVLRHLAELVFFIFDCSETAYPQEDQIKLMKRIKTFTKAKIIPIVSKSDLKLTIDPAIKKLKPLMISSHSQEGLEPLKEQIASINKE